MPDLSALNKTAFAILVNPVNFYWEVYINDGMKEEVYEQMKAVRREAMWNEGVSPAEGRETLARQAEGKDSDPKQSFLDFVDDAVFWDRDYEEIPPAMLEVISIDQNYYSLQSSLSDARAAIPRFSDIEPKLFEIAAFLNAEMGLPATHMDTLPAGHLSKAAFLRVTAAARAQRIARHTQQQ